jgi:hypothetical protein
MARIRHAYTQISPLVAPYFTTPTHDDLDAVTSVYGSISDSLFGQFAYGLSTSNGMVALIVSMIGGVLTAVVAMLFGVAGGASIWLGVVGGLVVLAALFGLTYSAITREQARIPVMFPTPSAEPVTDPQS